MIRRPPRSTLFPTRRSSDLEVRAPPGAQHSASLKAITARQLQALVRRHPLLPACRGIRSEEHTSELQSQSNLVCRLLLEKKKNRERQLKIYARSYRSQWNMH